MRVKAVLEKERKEKEAEKNRRMDTHRQQATMRSTANSDEKVDE